MELNEFHNNANSGHVSIRCRARRTADPFALLAGWQGPPGVSIRCCERRTVERSYLWVESSRSATFLFAVVRDVQRNTSRGKAGDSLAQILFVVVQDVQRNVMMMCQSNDEKTQLLFAVARDVQRNRPERTRHDQQILFAVVRDVQRNGEPVWNNGMVSVSIRCRARRTAERRRGCVPHRAGRFLFLFAVVRDVQRNVQKLTLDAGIEAGFYSLSCETYSGTLIVRRSPATASSFYSLSCETYRGTSSAKRSSGSNPLASFYSLSCETYSGTAGTGSSNLAIGTFPFAVVRDVQRNGSSPRSGPWP